MHFSLYARKLAPGAEHLRGARRGGRVGRTTWRVAAIRLILLEFRGGAGQQHRPPFPYSPIPSTVWPRRRAFPGGRAWLCIPPVSALAVWPRAEPFRCSRNRARTWLDSPSRGCGFILRTRFPRALVAHAAGGCVAVAPCGVVLMGILRPCLVRSISFLFDKYYPITE